MPKSRVRSKAVYTPPKRSAKAQVSPRWLVPTMVASLLLGLAWISLYYVTGGSNAAAVLGRGVEPGDRLRVHHRRRRPGHQVALARF